MQKNDLLARDVSSLIKLLPRGLSREREQELIAEARGDDETRRHHATTELVLNLMRFGIDFALRRKFVRNRKELGDCLGPITIGIMTAIRKYDPSRKLKLISSAVWHIQKELGESYQERVPGNVVVISDHIVKDKRKIKNARRELTRENGKAPSRADIAARTSMKVSQVAETEAIKSVGVSLDHKLKEGFTFEDVLIQKMFQSPEEIVFRAELRHTILRVCRRVLNKREQEVMTMRFFWGKTPKQVAQNLGITTQRVCQIESKMIQKLRKALPKAMRATKRTKME